jgi:hypothetical protein
MTKLILTAIVVVAGLILWVWKRYGSVKAQVARLEKKIGKILEEQQDALEEDDSIRFSYLDNERLRLCEEIARIRGR